MSETSSKEKKERMKILVFRLSSIGDIILTTPLVRALRKRFPSAHITFAVKREFADLVRHNPHINELLIFDKRTGISGLRNLKQNIQAQNFDMFLDIHRNMRSRFIRSGTNAKFVGLYSKQLFPRNLLVHFHINIYKEYKPVYLRYFESVERFHITYDGLGSELFFTEGDANYIGTRFKKEKIGLRDRILAIAPSASFLNKQWLPERFAEVAAHMHQKHNLKICLIGGPGDRLLCEKIRNMVPDAGFIVNFAGECTLLQSAALLQRSHIVLTNDSGMMHLAQSQKKPVVAIFGPTTKELGYFPIEEHSRVVEVPLPCRPCTHNGLNYCPRKHFRCMRNITTRMVVKALETLFTGAYNVRKRKS